MTFDTPLVDPRPWDPPEYWDPPEDDAPPALCWHIVSPESEDYAHSPWELTEIVRSLAAARLDFTAELMPAD